VSGEADCSVTAEETKLAIDDKKTLIAGPYAFICKSVTGEVITTLAQPLKWTFNVKTKMVGYQDPGVVLAAYSARQVKPATGKMTYDQNQGTLQVSTAELGVIAVLAAKTTGFAWGAMGGLVFGVILVVALLAGGFIWVIRRRQHTNYNEYLRSKYYNL
jgi:hypothetical protein